MYFNTCSSPDVKSKILKEENEKQNFDVSSDSSSSITSDKPLEGMLYLCIYIV